MSDLPDRVPRYAQLLMGEGVDLGATAETEDGKAAHRTFDIVAYTGAEVRPFFSRMILDLDGLSIGPKRKPVFRGHDRSKIVGHSEAIEVNDGKLLMSGHVTNITDAGREVAALADDKFPWQASMGVDLDRIERLDDGDSKRVNGRTFKGPGLIATKWRLKEVSFVPLGADDKTSGKVLGANDGDDLIEVEHREADMATKNDAPETKPADPSVAIATFAADHPDQVEKWKGAGKAAGEASERERHGALLAAFPERPKFVAEQFAAGADVPTAKAALADVLLAENADLTKQLAAKSAAPSDDDGHDGVDLGDGGKKKTASAGDSSREGVIEKARADFTADPSLARLTNERAHVNCALRDTPGGRLSDAECQTLGIQIVNLN